MTNIRIYVIRWFQAGLCCGALRVWLSHAVVREFVLIAVRNGLVDTIFNVVKLVVAFVSAVELVETLTLVRGTLDG